MFKKMLNIIHIVIGPLAHSLNLETRRGLISFSKLEWDIDVSHVLIEAGF